MIQLFEALNFVSYKLEKTMKNNSKKFICSICIENLSVKNGISLKEDLVKN